MQAHATGQPRVDIGAGVVETPPGRRRQPLRETPHVVVRAKDDGRLPQPAPVVDPHLPGSVDQHIGHPGFGEQALKRAGPDQFGPEHPGDGQDLGIAQDRPFGPQGGRHLGR